MTADNIREALNRIDKFNGQDPHQEELDGIAFPRELVYSKRLTQWVLKLNPQASDALRVAARGQHIGRWTLLRENYPEGRGGYLRWREDLKKFHAQTVADILLGLGHETSFVERVKFLIMKKNLREDPDTQTLEDALCLVFLEFQLADMKKKTSDDKLRDILRKTWAKMSEAGRAHALALPLDPALKAWVAGEPGQ